MDVVGNLLHGLLGPQLGKDGTFVVQKLSKVFGEALVGDRDATDLEAEAGKKEEENGERSHACR
jgi:hypothetical protein